MRKKFCPKCEKKLSVERFGVCKSRKDGLNAYCRVCIVGTVRAFRQHNHEAMAAIKERKRIEEEIERKKSVLAKVQNAVKSGCTTRDQIQANTELDWDDLGVALAELTFERGVLRIERVGKQRKFRLADQITEYAA